MRQAKLTSLSVTSNFEKSPTIMRTAWLEETRLRKSARLPRGGKQFCKFPNYVGAEDEDVLKDRIATDLSASGRIVQFYASSEARS
jgi:hypothetical protein